MPTSYGFSGLLCFSKTNTNSHSHSAPALYLTTRAEARVGGLYNFEIVAPHILKPSRPLLAKFNALFFCFSHGTTNSQQLPQFFFFATPFPTTPRVRRRGK